MSNLRPVDAATERAVLASYQSVRDQMPKSRTYEAALARLNGQASPFRLSTELRRQLLNRGLL